MGQLPRLLEGKALLPIVTIRQATICSGLISPGGGPLLRLGNNPWQSYKKLHSDCANSSLETKVILAHFTDVLGNSRESTNTEGTLFREAQIRPF